MAEIMPTTIAAETLHALRVSPAAHFSYALQEASTAGVVQLREVPFLTMVGLRIAAGSDAAHRIGSVIGPLPARCGEVTGTGEQAVLWLGPQEFLVVAPPEAHVELGGTLELKLAQALADGQGQVVDLSANRTTFELVGAATREVLQKGCSLDLHPGKLAVNTALSTEVGGIALILWRTGDDAYRLLPRASFSEFTARWLLDAMREYTPARAV